MIECKCENPDVEFTVVKDLASGLILLEARCENCGKSAEGYGRTVQQALMEVHRNWKKRKRQKKER